MPNKLNRNPLSEADEHIGRLEEYLEAARQYDGEDEMPQAQSDVVATLDYAVRVVKQHYRNLLHCYALHEKGERND